MYKVDITTINNLSQKAKASDRRRMNLNIHKTEEDVMQRFLNAMEPGTYIRPHKHEMPHKRELFAVVRGEFLMLEFDDTGNVTDSFTLSQSSGNFAVEIDPAVYHTVIALKVSSVALEVKDGPYDPKDDKIFAEWAPEEGDTANAKAFLEKTLNKLGIVFPNIF